ARIASLESKLEDE
ncbi:hypothetical protein KIPB_001448, partial [Kipferlia bialata]